LNRRHTIENGSLSRDVPSTSRQQRIASNAATPTEVESTDIRQGFLKNKPISFSYFVYFRTI